MQKTVLGGNSLELNWANADWLRALEAIFGKIASHEEADPARNPLAHRTNGQTMQQRAGSRRSPRGEEPT